MDHKVIEKIASQAASEVASAGGSSGGFLGIGSHTDLSARPKVDVELSGGTASVDLAITVAYPTPIRKVTDQVRQHLIDRVGELTGVEVTRVDITVSALHREAIPARRPFGEPPDARSKSLRRRPARTTPASIVSVVVLAVGVGLVWITVLRLLNGRWPRFLGAVNEWLATLRVHHYRRD